MPISYQIAGRVSAKKDLTKVGAESHFAQCIRQVFRDARPRKIIETGTYHGAGTTTVIAEALLTSGATDDVFYTIEVNPRHHQKAVANLDRFGDRVRVLRGLSVPRRLLPSVEQIADRCVRSVEADGLFVDHEEAERARLYHGETDFPDAPDDLLGKCIAEFDGRPEFVLLDSGGHMGYLEFHYVLGLLEGPCYVALDDIYHVKHHRSFREIQADPRFELVVASEEKFGFCIARFNPAGS